ncbi:sulfatase-like hydrolase/transferase [Pedobacter sp. UYP1]|uniref:sulfatase-like hydrolase/transferase n=1 Tax=Pedobacter sp. UYP1 TaxID=1756396 RepID=UPI003390E717
MGKIIEDWLSRAVFVYSFGLFFLIYKSTLYFASFEPLTFICFFAVYCLINYVILFVQEKLGLYEYGTLWLIFSWIIVLFIDRVSDLLSKFIDPSFFHLKYVIILIIIPCLILGLISKKTGSRKLKKLNPILNVFVFILIGLTLLSGIRLDQQEKKHTVALTNRKLPAFEIKNNKDLIWILLDEYADPASLKTQFKFHSYLVDSLETKGFFVFDTLCSRSDATVHSINSLFNLDDSISMPNYSYATNSLNQSLWIKSLQQKGYEFVNLDFFNIGGHPKFYLLRFFTDNYIDQLIEGSVFSILVNKAIKEEMPADRYNQKIVSAFNLKVREKRAKPVFIWAHLLIPHEPFYRGANGQLNKDPVLDTKSSSPAKVASQYTAYLNYGNKVVLEMLNGIPDWRNKTIVISGDHGARMLVPDNDPRRKQPFGAIYYPGMDKRDLNKIKYMQQIPFHLH